MPQVARTGPPPLSNTGGAAVLARLRSERAASAAAVAAKAAEAAAQRTATFLYASQTGTAEEIAHSMHDEALQKGIKSQCASMDEWTAARITAGDTPVLIIIASSTGDGEAPDNAAHAVMYLQRATAGAPLGGVMFTVMGLGDSNYTKFMAVPRTIRRRLLEQGAVEFYDSGEADEVDGLEDVVDAWRDRIWDALQEAVAPQSSLNGEAADDGADAQQHAANLPADYTKQGHLVEAHVHIQGVPALRASRAAVTLVPAPPGGGAAASDLSLAPTAAQRAHRDAGGRYSEEAPFWARLAEARALTAPGCPKRVLHVGLDVAAAGMRFVPGDAMSLSPCNAPALVDGLLAHLQLDPDQVVERVDWTDGSVTGTPLPHLRRGRSLRCNLLWACDLTSAPSKALLVALAHCAADARERATLLFLASRDGRAAYKADVADGRPTLLQLLRRYRSCRPAAPVLLEALPALRPRLYSLSNAPSASPGALECAFHVVEYETHWGPHEGVATTWLERASRDAGSGGPELWLPVHLRPSTGFAPPDDAGAPIIMVGPGTGVAPFRGFLQHRRAQAAAGAALGESWLFFGNWRREWDYLYEAEVEAFKADGTLSHLCLAWSRETDQKVYVQHRMEAEGAALCEALLERGAYLFVCGDGTRMAKDVHAAVSALLQKHGDLDAEEAGDFLRDLAGKKRYLKDVWL